jgi:hypothetical protein
LEIDRQVQSELDRLRKRFDFMNSNLLTSAQGLSEVNNLFLLAHQADDRKINKRESEKQNIKAEIENTVRREWEVKARLEIDRQVQSRRRVFPRSTTSFSLRIKRMIGRLIRAEVSGR